MAIVATFSVASLSHVGCVHRLIGGFWAVVGGFNLYLRHADDDECNVSGGSLDRLPLPPLAASRGDSAHRSAADRCPHGLSHNKAST